MSPWQRRERSPGLWALHYVSWSWRILPLHTANRGVCSCGDPECASPGKHPRTVHGVHDASRRSEQARRWWATWPDANVGIATGPLIVIDVDGEQGHAALIALQTRHGSALPATPWVQTARGRHLYFLARHPQLVWAPRLRRRRPRRRWLRGRPAQPARERPPLPLARALRRSRDAAALAGPRAHLTARYQAAERAGDGHRLRSVSARRPRRRARADHRRVPRQS